MNPSLFAKATAAAALALGSLGMAQAAHAGTDLYFSFGVPVPAYVESAPVYVAPQPSYVYEQPPTVYVRPGYDDWRWRRNEWRRAEWRREQWRREHWRQEHERHEHEHRRRDGRDWD